jgi:CRISPR-associated endonuclease/helicase Cas3
MTLTADSFDIYFKDVHGHTPFRWQRRLLDEVLADGWTRPLDLPTGSGKTAVLDIAVFALAVQASFSAAERKTPRRICLVVDRRIVVDDAHRRAARIVKMLRDPQTPTLREVAQSLLALGGETPVEAAALRGGIYREDRWARTPLQPVILCSTVDQVGSRLLHRGYGLSSRAWPIHAGLLGHDTLIVLDEAHCSRPFLQTLDTIAKFRRQAIETLPGPWAAIAMTATPRDGATPFSLRAEERREPELARRLDASKRVDLRVARQKGDDGIVAEIRGLFANGPIRDMVEGRTILVVCNRVRAARGVYDALDELKKTGHMTADTVLLTGRTRPAERDRLVRDHAPRMMAGRLRPDPCGKGLVVIATQCVEVGADLDVDMLISEACPIDSLRQRLGRLDRLGRLGSTSAIVICRPEYEGTPAERTLPKVPDPVYGQAITYAWWWLVDTAQRTDTLDLGISAFERTANLTPPSSDAMSASADAPMMLAPYVDLWAQTGPEPSVSPDTALFLHGRRSAPAEIGVVWRDDLDSQRPDLWAATVSEAPPISGEVLQVPLHTARAWLRGHDADPGSDIEGASARPEDEEVSRDARKALLWRGLEDSRILGPDELPPGSIIVVPCAWGGCDRMGWTGRRTDVPEDLLDAATSDGMRIPVLRLTSGRKAPWRDPDGPPQSWRRIADIVHTADDGVPSERELRGAIGSALRDWRGAMADGPTHDVLQALEGDARALRIRLHPSGRGFVVSGRRRLLPDGRDFSDEDDLSSLAAVGTVGLAAHLADVGTLARHFAAGVGLPAPLVAAVAAAGRLHDLGKADPRFNAWLVGGDWTRVDPAKPLAKSDRIRTGAESARARALSRYPAGARHELLSIRLAESAPELLPQDPALRDLVLHLVASHHGHCRPWAPAIADPRPITVRYVHDGRQLHACSDTRLERVDSGVAARFWRLVRLHGWWGLSFLEACMRLADHRASENPGRLEDTEDE